MVSVIQKKKPRKDILSCPTMFFQTSCDKRCKGDIEEENPAANYSETVGGWVKALDTRARRIAVFLFKNK